MVIRHCDEFDAPSRPAMWGPSHQAIEPEPSDVECAGLCRNCALAAGCTYPKPVAGVWRCEEYC